jgi:carbonic anhydrase/acetyltransferase-like protein (isoleucine patch superfamily)
MALIVPFGGHTPRIARDVFIAPNATIVGDVEIAEGASVWFGAVLRGDIGPIRVGPRTNVQDLACLHLTEGVSETIVGAEVTIGHGAILHGCVIGDRCLVGMGSIVLDNAMVGESSVIAAGSVVTARSVIPPRSLVRGAPARIIREATAEEAALGVNGAAHYLQAAHRFRAVCADITEVAPYEIRGEVGGMPED